MPHASRLSELGILTPGQYSDQFHTSPLLPEKRLMLAVLLDAVECFQKYALLRKARSHPIFNDAKTWIFEDDDERLFSFINICEAIGLNPQYLRNGLSHWKNGALPREDVGAPLAIAMPQSRIDGLPTAKARAVPLLR